MSIINYTKLCEAYLNFNGIVMLIAVIGLAISESLVEFYFNESAINAADDIRNKSEIDCTNACITPAKKNEDRRN